MEREREGKRDIERGARAKEIHRQTYRQTIFKEAGHQS